MARLILVFGLLALAACASPQSGDSSSQQPVHGMYGSFNGGVGGF